MIEGINEFRKKRHARHVYPNAEYQNRQMREVFQLTENMSGE